MFYIGVLGTVLLLRTQESEFSVYFCGEATGAESRKV